MLLDSFTNVCIDLHCVHRDPLLLATFASSFFSVSVFLDMYIFYIQKLRSFSDLHISLHFSGASFIVPYIFFVCFCFELFCICFVRFLHCVYVTTRSLFLFPINFLFGFLFCHLSYAPLQSAI